MWKKITKEMKESHYLVTNNLKARDAFGRMSHLWLTTYVQKSSDPDNDGKFICYTDFGSKIFNLTHYLDLGPVPGTASGKD